MEPVQIVTIGAICLANLFVCYYFINFYMKRAKKYETCVYQVVDMLRAYNQNPDEDDFPDCSTAVWNISNNIFGELKQNLPKDEQMILVELYTRER